MEERHSQKLQNKTFETCFIEDTHCFSSYHGYDATAMCTLAVSPFQNNVQYIAA